MKELKEQNVFLEQRNHHMREKYKEETRQLKAASQQLQKDHLLPHRSHVDTKDMKIRELTAELQNKIVEFSISRNRTEEITLLYNKVKSERDNLFEEFQKVKSEQQSQKVVRTISDIPGISPLKLLQVFSGDFVKMKAEIDSFQRLQENYQSEIQSLQKKMTIVNQPQKERISIDTAASNSSPPVVVPVAAGSSHGLPPHSPHPFHESKTVSPPERSSSPTASRMHQYFERAQRKRSPSPMRTSGMNNNNSGRLPTLSPNSINLRIDDETTPKTLLESLDLAILQNKLISQENTIRSLEEELQQLKDPFHGQLHSSEEKKEFFLESLFQDFILITKEEQIQNDSCRRQVDLLTRNYDDVRKELENARKINLQLEKQKLSSFISDLRKTAAVGSENDNKDSNKDDPLEEKRTETSSIIRGGNNPFEEELPFLLDASSTDESHFRDDRPSATRAILEKQLATMEEENEKNKRILHERTSQLKVLMETLESLHLVDSSQVAMKNGNDNKYKDLNDQVKDMENDLLNLAYSKAPVSSSSSASSSPWIVQSLSKRIIELTTELLSTISLQELDKQRNQRLEQQTNSQMNEINRLTVKYQKQKQTITRLEQTVEKFLKEKTSNASNFLEENHSMKTENEKLLQQLQEKEMEVNRLSFQLKEIDIHTVTREKNEFKEVLQLLHLDFGEQSKDRELNDSDYYTSFSTGAAGKKEKNENELKEMIKDLLLHWKEKEKSQANMFESGSISSSSKIRNKQQQNTLKHLNKPEKEFLQKVSDFVLSINGRLNAKEEELSHLLQSQQFFDQERKKFENSFYLLLQETKKTKEKLSFYEKNFRKAEEILLIHPSTMIGDLYHQKYVEEKKNKEMIFHEKNSVSQKYFLLKLNYAILFRERSLLIAKNAEYESKGDKAFQEKENCISSLRDMIAEKEKKFLDFVDKELPRLLSGLPINEFDRFMHSPDQLLWNITGMSRESSLPSFLPSSSAVSEEQLRQLSQSLCLSKANESKQEMIIGELTEKLIIGKEKLSRTERVLVKWKDKIENDLSLADNNNNHRLVFPSSSSFPTPASFSLEELIKELEKKLLLSQEKENRYYQEISQRDNLLVEREEEIIEWRNKCEMKTTQCKQLQVLVDHSLDNDEIIKQKAIQQLNKLRLDLEKEHSSELRKLTSFYEEEKKKLIIELVQLSSAITDAGVDLDRFHFENKENDEMEEEERSFDEEKGEKKMKTREESSDSFDVLPAERQPTKLREQHKHDNTSSSSSFLEKTVPSQNQHNKEFKKYFNERDHSSQNNEDIDFPLKKIPTTAATRVEETTQPPATGSLRSGSSITSQSGKRANQTTDSNPNPNNKENQLNNNNVIDAGSNQSFRSNRQPLQSTTERTLYPTKRMTESATQTVQFRENETAFSSDGDRNQVNWNNNINNNNNNNPLPQSDYNIVFERIPQRLLHRHRSSSASSNGSSSSPPFPDLLLPNHHIPHYDESSSENNTLKAQIEAIDKYHELSTSNQSNNNNNQNNSSSDLLLNLQQENFVRTLELEKRKNTELFKEIQELEELLAIQHKFIRENISRGKGNDREREREEYDQSREQMRRMNRPFEEEILKEDQSLWPQLSSLGEGLLTLLHTLLSRFVLVFSRTQFHFLIISFLFQKQGFSSRS
jgi:hypothetical protein